MSPHPCHDRVILTLDLRSMKGTHSWGQELKVGCSPASVSYTPGMLPSSPYFRALEMEVEGTSNLQPRGTSELDARRRGEAGF